ncbi:MAG: MarR family transcriptional regulator, partial [Chloroflexi bacterium]|nr:MarR family transcriptional regulator [Chloroflexota bacterium]
SGQGMSDAWMELDLSVAQLRTLFLISRDANASAKRLSEKLGVTPSNVSGLVDRLFRQGLVSRQEDPDDRRVLRLRVTDKGASVLADLKEMKTSPILAVLARMSAEDLSVLARGLSLLAEAAEAHRDTQDMP